MKKIGLVVLSLLIVTLSFSAVFADPSSLIIVRASDNSLWKATCQGTTCTGFTSFPGAFASQPTVYWDEHNVSWVVWGRASDNSIWRSTFDWGGNFNNDWTRVPGATASPVGAAGGSYVNNSFAVSPSGTSVTLGTSATNIMNDYVVCPFDGLVNATASGTIAITHSSNTDYGVVDLSETATTVGSTYQVAQIPAGATAGLYAFPFSITRTFSCPAGGGDKYVYLTGRASNAGNTSVIFTGLYFQYFPYAL